MPRHQPTPSPAGTRRRCMSCCKWPRHYASCMRRVCKPSTSATTLIWRCAFGPEAARIGVALQCPEFRPICCRYRDRALAAPGRLSPKIILGDGLKAQGILTAGALGPFENSGFRIGLHGRHPDVRPTWTARWRPLRGVLHDRRCSPRLSTGASNAWKLSSQILDPDCSPASCWARLRTCRTRPRCRRPCSPWNRSARCSFASCRLPSCRWSVASLFVGIALAR